MKTINEKSFEVPEQIREPVMVAMGEASMCWETPGGAGEFDSTNAKSVGDRLCQTIMAEFQRMQEIPE